MLSLLCVALFALFQSSFAQSSGSLNQYINVGSSETSQNDIVENGQYNLRIPENGWKVNLDHNEYPMSHKPAHALFVTLRDDASISVNLTVKWQRVLGGGGYIAKTQVDWAPDQWTANHVLLPGRTARITFSQPTGDPETDEMVGWDTGCGTAQDNTAVNSYFEIHTDDLSLRLNLVKDCRYPRIAVGTSSASLNTIDDIIKPNNQGTLPRLKPTFPFNLTFTPNTPSRQIIVAMETGGSWVTGETTDFVVKYSAAPNDPISVSSSTESGTLQVAVIEDIVNANKFVVLSFRSVCSATAITNRMTGNVTAYIYAGFSRPYELDIFQVECGEPSGPTDSWPNLTIQPVASSQLVGYDTSYVYRNNEVQELWTPEGWLVNLGRQQQSLTFRFSYDADRKYSAWVQAVSVTESSLASVKGGIELFNGETNQRVANNTAYQFPTSGRFDLRLDNTCWQEGQMIIDILLSDIKLEGRTGEFRPIEFRFKFQCVLPKFSITTPAFSSIVNNGNATDGLYDGFRLVEVQKGITPYANTIVITTTLSSDKLSDPLVVYLQEELTNYEYLFTWKFDPLATSNLNDADVILNGQLITGATGAKNYVLAFPLNSNSDDSRTQRLSIDRFTCEKRGSVSVRTWLLFGFSTRIELVWERQCTDVPDVWDDGSSEMSDGAIFGIVVAVLIAVGCLGGIAYNSIKLGKTGLSVIPGVDTFNAWNDGVKGPKRYSTDISKSSKSKVQDVEIHSLGYGSYQQSDDGYVDEIDTL